MERLGKVTFQQNDGVAEPLERVQGLDATLGGLICQKAGRCGGEIPTFQTGKLSLNASLEARQRDTVQGPRPQITTNQKHPIAKKSHFLV